MQIQFQICGLCILSLLLVFYKSHKTFRLYKEHVFYAVMCIMLAALAADILSLVAIAYRAELPAVMVDFVCKFYLALLALVTSSAMLYVLSDLVAEQQHRKLLRWFVVISCVQSMMVLLLPVSIFAEGSVMYTYGPSVKLVYALTGVYILSTIVLAICCRDQINPRRRWAIILWMLIWLGSAALQFVNDGLLVVGFAGALGVLVLFVVIENPEANMERKFGCFNSYALTEYLKHLYIDQEPFGVLEVSFQNSRFLEDAYANLEVMVRKILQITDQDILVFKNNNLSLVMIHERAEVLKAGADLIEQTFSDMEAFQKGVRMILIDHADAFVDMEDLFRFLDFIEKNRKEEIGHLILADSTLVVQYQERGRMEQEIRAALEEDRVEIFLQPIYSSMEQRFSSAEALVRIRQRDGTLLPPGAFIPVAEKNGQILELGERVFEKVCAFLKQHDTASLGLRYVEINLSVLQCEKADLAKRLISIVEAYQVDPRQINLEITETASISAQKILQENMEQLIAYGFTFSLDDFGKGESNLMYVVEMPVAIVKMDYDLSKAFFHSEKAQHVVRAVVGMAHGMGIRIVAEGIETKEEKMQMAAEGIDYIQGYYYSKPLPIPEFLQFLQQWRSEE